MVKEIIFPVSEALLLGKDHLNNTQSTIYTELAQYLKIFVDDKGQAWYLVEKVLPEDVNQAILCVKKTQSVAISRREVLAVIQELIAIRNPNILKFPEKT